MTLARTLLMTAALMATTSLAHAEQKLEVLHFWTSGGDAEAAKVLMQALAAKGIVWEDSPTTNTNNLNQVLRSRAVSGSAPAAVKLHMSEVLPWQQADFLQDINAAATAGDWDKVMQPSLIAGSKIDGSYYAVPMGVHGTNWMWFNKKVFEANGLTPPTTWDEFKAVSEKLKAAGIIPLALGGQDWQEGALFETVVLAVGGPDFYKKALIEQDEATLRSDTMVKVFEEYRNLNTYVDPNYPGRDWNVAAQMVMKGEAAMQILGDYAKGEFALAGLKQDVDYGCMLSPGTSGSYIDMADVFSFFKSSDPAIQEAQQTMAGVLLDKDVQLAFSQKKGSIPARNDVSVDGLDLCGQKAYQFLSEAEANGTVLPAVSHMEGTTPAKAGVFLEVSQTFFESPEMTAQEAIDRLVSGLQAAAE